MGRPLDEARRILGPYGTVHLSVWPDWVSTVPTLDGRVELTLERGRHGRDARPDGHAMSHGDRG